MKKMYLFLGGTQLLGRNTGFCTITLRMENIMISFYEDLVIKWKKELLQFCTKRNKSSFESETAFSLHASHADWSWTLVLINCHLPVSLQLVFSALQNRPTFPQRYRRTLWLRVPLGIDVCNKNNAMVPFL